MLTKYEKRRNFTINMNLNERLCQAFCGAMGVGQRFFIIRLVHPEKKLIKVSMSIALMSGKPLKAFLFHLSFNYEPHLNDLVAGVCGT